MGDYFRVLAAHAAHKRLAIIDPVQSSTAVPIEYSYADLLTRVAVFRESIIEKGLRHGKSVEGARIGVMIPPGVDFTAAILSAWSVKAIAVPICLTHPLQEITYTVTNSDQDFIFYHTDFASKIAELLESRIGINVTEIPTNAVPKKNTDFSKLQLPADISCTIIYTSGTTGLPKGAVQTPRGSEHSFRSLSKAWQISAKDRVLHVLPLHHGHGLSLSLLLPLWAGATVEFMSKFDEVRVWRRFVDPSLPPVTVFMAVPTIWVKMISHFREQLQKDPNVARRAKAAAAAIRLAISGSAALPSPVRDAWAEIANGYLLLERYGTTETGIIYTGQLSPGGRILGSVGWPVPGVKTRLIADDGRDVSNIPNVVGEIQVKTDGMIKEYWQKTGAMDKDITSDGWWRTGDMALIKAEHNNATFIQGRASVDIIKSGGYKISALDIETELLQLPFVQEAAVLGVPDVTWGEVVAAVCVPTKGRESEVTVANVRENLRKRLAPYKLPQRMHVLEVMPRNAMGKIQKKPLREQCFPTSRAVKL